MKPHAFRSVIAIVLFSTVVFGCGKQQATCTDVSTISLVRQGVDEALKKVVPGMSNNTALIYRVKQRIDISINNIRTSTKDEKIGKVTCEATLAITLTDIDQIRNDPTFKSIQERKAIDGDTIKMDGAVWSSEIQYTAQHTEDTKNLMVELGGHAPLVMLLAALAQGGAMNPRLP